MLGSFGVVTGSAVYAPRQHDTVGVFLCFLRRVLPLCLRGYSSIPSAAPEDALHNVVLTRNDLGRLAIGISPSQLVFNRQPRRLLGDDLNEDADTMIYSDPTFAADLAKRAKAEPAWIQAHTWKQIGRMSSVHVQEPKDLHLGGLCLLRRRLLKGTAQRRPV